MLCLFGATCLLLVCWFVSCFRSKGTHEPIDLRETCASSRSRETATTTTTNTFTVLFWFWFWFWFYFWKLQNMCYEKQAGKPSEAKQSKAKQRKYCRDVRTANQPAFHMASGLLFFFFSFGWLYYIAKKGILKK